MMYRLSFQIEPRGHPLGMVVTNGLSVEHTIVDEDPVNLIERALLALENERDELLSKRDSFTPAEEASLVKKYTRYDIDPALRDKLHPQTKGDTRTREFTQENITPSVWNMSTSPIKPCSQSDAAEFHRPHLRENSKCAGFPVYDPNHLRTGQPKTYIRTDNGE